MLPENAQDVRDVGIEPGAAFERYGTRVWDLELDGDRRRGLKVSLIDEGRDDGAVVVWAHLAPPLGDEALPGSRVTAGALTPGGAVHQAWMRRTAA